MGHKKFAFILFLQLLNSSCKTTHNKQMVSDTSGFVGITNLWQTKDIKICWSNKFEAEYSPTMKKLEDYLISNFEKITPVKFIPSGICPVEIDPNMIYVEPHIEGGKARTGGFGPDATRGAIIYINFKGGNTYEHLKEPFVHEIFHRLGVYHELERIDAYYNTNTKRDYIESMIGYYEGQYFKERYDSKDKLVIGKLDLRSVASYSNYLSPGYSQTQLLSPGDLFTLGFMFGFSRTSEFKKIMYETSVVDLLRAVPTKFPVEFNYNQRNVLATGAKGDIVLWVQMILNLENKINYTKHNMIFDQAMINALKEYQKVNGLNITGEIDQATWEFMVSKNQSPQALAAKNISAIEKLKNFGYSETEKDKNKQKNGLIYYKNRSFFDEFVVNNNLDIDTKKQMISALPIRFLTYGIPKLPYVPNDSERVNGVINQYSELYLWIQLLLSTVPELNYSKNDAQVDGEFIEALNRYQSLNGLSPSEGAITPELFKHFEKISLSPQNKEFYYRWLEE